MARYLGIDPGKSGAMALIDDYGRLVDEIRLKETDRDVWAWLRAHVLDGQFDRPSKRIELAVLERVSAMPRQGVASTFKFGQSFGFVRGLLIASGVRFETATPTKWQRAMGCLSKGDKNVTKAKAQELFPGAKVVHANADAMLLAEYARRLDASRRAER